MIMYLKLNALGGMLSRRKALFSEGREWSDETTESIGSKMAVTL
jgi:hypothetical protein